MKKNFLIIMLFAVGLLFLGSEFTKAQSWTQNATPNYTTKGVKILNFQGYVFSQDTLISNVVEKEGYNEIIQGVKKVSRTSTTPKLKIEKFIYGIDGWTKVKTLATADSSSTESFFTDTLHYGNTRYLFIGDTASGDSSVFKFKLEKTLK